MQNLLLSIFTFLKRFLSQFASAKNAIRSSMSSNKSPSLTNQSISKNSNGFSLVEVMIASGIMTLVGLGLSTMMVNQSKQVRGLTDKLMLLELNSQMRNLFANRDYCNCAFRGKRFNTTTLNIFNADQLNRLKTGYSTGPSDIPPCTEVVTDFIPPAGSQVPNSNLLVEQVRFSQMTQTSPGKYKGLIEVKLNSSAMDFKPINTEVQFSVDLLDAGGPTARPFVSCGAASTAPIADYDSGWVNKTFIGGGAYGNYYGPAESRVTFTHGLGVAPSKVEILCSLQKNAKTIELSNHISVIDDSRVQGTLFDATSIVVTFERYIYVPHFIGVDPLNFHYDICSQVRARAWR